MKLPTSLSGRLGWSLILQVFKLKCHFTVWEKRIKKFPFKRADQILIFILHEPGKNGIQYWTYDMVIILIIDRYGCSTNFLCLLNWVRCVLIINILNCSLMFQWQLNYASVCMVYQLKTTMMTIEHENSLYTTITSVLSCWSLVSGPSFRI